MANEWWKRQELAFIYGDKQEQQNPNMPTEAVGFTGKGPDGIAQPDRRTPGMGNGDYDAHEAEYIVDANATSAIGSDILDEVVEASKNGGLDHNKLREAIGQPSKPGYQTGGLSSKPKEAEGIKRSALTPIKPTVATPSPVAAPVTQQAVGAPPLPKPMSPTPGGQQGEITNINPDIKIDPIAVGQQTGTQTDPTDPTNYMRDLMGGDNPYIDAIKKQAAQDIGGAGAAGTAAIKQEAAQAGMSAEQIASMGVTRQRDVEEQTGEVVGNIATAEAQMGVQAARDVFSQDMATDQFKYQQDMNQFSQQLAQGDYTGAAESFNKMHGTDIDFSKAIDAENLSNFNNAQNGMTQSIGNNVPFDDWLKTAQADGTFDKLNMTESDVKSMYENMRLQQNPIYQASKRYQDLVDQGIISQDQMDDILAIQSHMLANPDGYSVTDSFQVTDENGKEIGNFKTKEEADTFAAENPGSKTGILNRGWVERTGVGTNSGTVTDTGDVVDTTTDEYKDLKGLIGEDPSPDLIKAFDENFEVANALTKNDFGELSTDDITGLNDVYTKMPKSWQEKNNFVDILKKIDKDEGELYEAIHGENVVKDSEGAGKMLNSAWGKWTKDGKNRWVMGAPMQAFLKANKGKYVQLGGKYFKIQGYNADGGDRNSSPTVTLYDPVSKQQVSLSSSKSATYIEGAAGLQAAYPDFFTAFVNPMSGRTQSKELLNSWPDDSKSKVEMLG